LLHVKGTIECVIEVKKSEFLPATEIAIHNATLYNNNGHENASVSINVLLQVLTTGSIDFSLSLLVELLVNSNLYLN